MQLYFLPAVMALLIIVSSAADTTTPATRTAIGTTPPSVITISSKNVKGTFYDGNAHLVTTRLYCDISSTLSSLASSSSLPITKVMHALTACAAGVTDKKSMCASEYNLCCPTNSKSADLWQCIYYQSISSAVDGNGRSDLTVS